MTTPLLWLAVAGPLGLAGVSLLPDPPSAGLLQPRARRGLTVDATSRLAIGAALLSLAVSLAAVAAAALYGPIGTGTIGIAGAGFALYIDRLSAAMFVLVSLVGVVVAVYSKNYLDGDPGHARFMRLLCRTLAAVLLVIIAGNLLHFTLAWIATSLCLQELLIFYPERPAARMAARKKFIASRIGDACLIGAALLLYRDFGSLDYGQLFAAAHELRADGDVPAHIHAVALLFVGAALLKSAQFPMHGWLIEVMETPTPVSALLHAGIINAGGFLVLRFSSLIAMSLPSLDTLAIIGGFTALFGSVVMLTQTSIKVSLAYSTIAQMGFMMLECGLGAFSAALLHILAHSFYKAHAFLSSGSVIDIARASYTPAAGRKPHPWRVLFAIAAVLGVTFAISTLFGATLTAKPGVFALGAVALLGIVHLVANGIDERPDAYVLGRTALLAVMAASAYFGLQYTAEHVFANALPMAQAARGPLGVAIVAAVVLSFATVVFLQGLVPRHAKEPRWQALYAHVANGFYVNTIANRLVLRLWPSPPRDVPGSFVTGV